MPPRSPLRFLAPGALLGVLVAVFLVVQNGTQESPVNPTAGTTTTKAVKAKGRRTYTVRPGDTLSQIAKRYDLTVDQLLELNPKVDPQALRTKQRLRLRD